MILEIQIKGQTTRLSMEQAHALYKELAPLFKEVPDWYTSPDTFKVPSEPIYSDCLARNTTSDKVMF